VIAVPGLTPRSPEMMESPVLVTVDPARTANDPAIPNPTGGCAAAADGAATSTNVMTRAATTPVTAVHRRRPAETTRIATDKRRAGCGARCRPRRCTAPE